MVMKNLWNTYDMVWSRLVGAWMRSEFRLKYRVYIQGGALTIFTILFYVLVALFN